MGQKHHPVGMRVGITKGRFSERFGKKKSQSAQLFVDDMKLRKAVTDFFGRVAIAKVVVRQTIEESELIIFTGKPGMMMGKEGSKMKEFEQYLASRFTKTVTVTIKSVKVPELSANIIAEDIATQIENRMPFRRVAKQTLQTVSEKGAMGIKIQIAGRLGGADMARTEKFIEGRVPLQTFREDIDYAYIPAVTKYGVIGVKVWIAKKTTKYS